MIFAMYLVYFYAPEDKKEVVKKAMFDAGAGRIGEYEHCSFEVSGRGQYKPKSGANPYQGEVGKLEKATEVKVEMVCNADCLEPVLRALLKSHPYEEPAYGACLIQTMPQSKMM